MNDSLLTYDIALSFAGDDRAYVEQIANAARQRGLAVFYDRYEEAGLWGKDLYSHLTSVYRDQAKFCLIFASESYAQKQWTNHERRAAQARAFKESEEYILPLRMDDTPVEGVLETTGFVDSRQRSVDEIVGLLETKVHGFNRRHGITEEIHRVEDVFEAAGIRLPGGRSVSDAWIETTCPTCKAAQLLSDARVTVQGGETVYECKNGCQAIAVVGRHGTKAWPGRGYRLRAFVIRNAADLLCKRGGPLQDVLIPASPAALMKNR